MEILLDYVWEINQREKNEDAIAYRQYRNHKKDCCIAVVSDGIGGMEHGEDASSYIVSQLLDAMEEFVTKKQGKKRLVRNFFMRKIYGIHERIMQYGVEQHCRLGATLSMVVILQGRGYIFHTGDSTVYWGRNHLLFRTPEHRKGNCLERAIGTGEYHNPYFRSFPFRKKMRFLICTDGWNRKTENQIPILWKERKGIKNRPFSCKDILQLAVSLGEKDNISAVYMERMK